MTDRDAPPAWWRTVSGWPAGVPVDDRVVLDAAAIRGDDARRADIDRRLERSFDGLRMARASRTALVVATGAFVLTVVIDRAIRAAYPGMPLGGLAILGAVAISVVTLHRLRTLPLIRASLRGAGLDVCVRCGHAIMGDASAATCPECGFDHRHLPLDWAQRAEREHDEDTEDAPGA